MGDNHRHTDGGEQGFCNLCPVDDVPLAVILSAAKDLWIFPPCGSAEMFRDVSLSLNMTKGRRLAVGRE
jgi:hypothetical protein